MAHSESTGKLPLSPVLCKILLLRDPENMLSGLARFERRVSKQKSVCEMEVSTTLRSEGNGDYCNSSCENGEPLWFPRLPKESGSSNDNETSGMNHEYSK